MNMKHAHYISTILREGSFTAASRVLYVSQPALTQVVKTVEQELGESLFERGKSGLHLTFAGKLYLEAAKKIQMIEMNLKNHLSDQKKEVHATLRFGISAQRGRQLLPHIIPRYMQLYPYIRIELIEHGSGTLEKLVNDGECDIALITTEPHLAGLNYHLLENEQLVLMASPDSELSKRFQDGTPIDLKEAANESFVTLKQGHSVRSIQDHLFNIHHLNPKILLESNNFATAINVAAFTKSVMLCPYVYIASSPHIASRVKCFPIDCRGYERHLYMCYPKEMYFSKYMDDLRIIIQETLESSAMNIPTA